MIKPKPLIICNSEVKFHWSWWLLIAITNLEDLILFDIMSIIYNLLYLSILFVSVLGHEVAHIFVANTLGYKSKYIIITSIGGLSLIDLKDADYIEKILIALVGPIFNIIIGLFFLLINSFLIHLNLGSNDIVIIMMMVNLFLGFFNLLPMYPADGCTIFESLIMTLNPHNLQANLFLVKTTSLLTGLVMVCMGLYLLMNYHHYYMYVI